jgi:hypothetical protein
LFQKDILLLPFFEAIFKYQDIIITKKYANNYDYNKAVLMSNFKLLDNGFNDKGGQSHASPISSVFYEFYDDINALKTRLQSESIFSAL